MHWKGNRRAVQKKWVGLIPPQGSQHKGTAKQDNLSFVILANESYLFKQGKLSFVIIAKESQHYFISLNHRF